ncbi:hypothetical protein F4804DRAFT_13407 [Jackrogersella minutella]|nr:hypothetical protein F4804DRAFT_13407 [Jackrogersella minutella]
MIIAESTREHIIRTCQQLILERRWFRTIDHRKESISQAHSKTFSCVFQPPEGSFPWDDLPKWLLCDSGICWISGKAGSGKSTLMKYLFQHRETKRLLSQWAGHTPCYAYHFFFWNMGTHEQKSQEGLARALLYHILSNHPSLIAEVLPSMWRQLLCSDGEPNLPSKHIPRYSAIHRQSIID